MSTVKTVITKNLEDNKSKIKAYTVVGKSIPRIEGPLKATGQAKYTTDIELPGMLYAKILRSPYPHALIKSIDTEEAENFPGVKAVMTGQDVANVRNAYMDTPRYPADEQPLAVHKVRYIGDEVAAVAAESEEIAEEALSLIKVEYEILPAVFTAVEAMSDDAPLIHEEEFEGTTAWEEWLGVGPVEKNPWPQPYSNMSGHTKVNFGDVDKGFKEADYVREDSFELNATAHCPMEPHAAVASFDPVEGKLHVWLSTMGIFFKRYHLTCIPGKLYL